ncbi:MAG: TIGR04211 family SH3 domain-containing protein [Deltaproteobacteria bacterium]|nr:TIGR04211 family SH3 domain-containing protein [Deltaproteobacteria bacterium]MBW2393374.1 TIGR04211 family SH3 domain-containing protein [Deltaproteobacteria bacterium]
MSRGIVVACLAGLWLLAGAVQAEKAWVRGAPLNLRSGPGTAYRILASSQPGDPLEVLKRGDGWTQVRTVEGKTGWIAAGYLDPEAPPAVRLSQIEAEAERLRSTLASTTDEADRLRESNSSLSSSDSGQKESIERLTQENYKLRAGTRYAEWLMGALIFCTGMALGAILHGLSGRRRGSRLRL